MIGALTAGLVVVRLVLDPGVIIGLVAAAVASVVMLRLTRDSLQLSSTFPELARIRLLRSVVRSPLSPNGQAEKAAKYGTWLL